MKKWTYRMEASVDDKKYSVDQRKFSTAVNSDGIFKKSSMFNDSPITDLSLVKDVCIYKPGDLNKNGKEGRTSWDSFSYAIQMGHNVWMHINSVQEANRQYDQGVIPNMMAFDTVYERKYFRDVVDRIFETDDRNKALELVEEYNKFWISVIGTRGATGKKTVNSSTMFNKNFDIEEPVEYHRDDSGLDDDKLSNLEELVDER
jgi:hypothetical protein